VAQLGMQECYRCLPQKVLAFLEMVASRYYVNWLVKIDDDVYLNPDRFVLGLMQWGNMNADYVACMTKGAVIDDPSHNWHEPAHVLLGKDYHMRAFGSLYILSGSALRDVIIPNKDRLRLLGNEGVMLASVLTLV
jgi:hypothetical protein